MKRPRVDDTESLIARVRSGDISAFERIYDRHAPLVFGVALRMLGDPATAEDVAQSVFFSFWQQPDRYRSGNFPGWLTRVTRNRALDQLRKRSTHHWERITEASEIDDDFSDRIAGAVDGDRARTALESLTPEQRLPIELGFFEGLTHEEIARRISAPLGTIKTRIRSGLQRLRSVLEGEVRA